MQTDFKVVIKDEAHADIADIFEYYLHRSLSVEVAENVTDKLYCVIFGLSFMPYTRPMILEYNNPNYRKSICGEYVIPFVMNNDTKTVTVSRVFHGKSNYQKYL